MIIAALMIVLFKTKIPFQYFNYTLKGRALPNVFVYDKNIMAFICFKIDLKKILLVLYNKTKNIT